MWAGQEPLVLGQLSSPSPTHSSSSPQPHPTQDSPCREGSARPGTAYVSSASSPSLFQPHFGLHMHLATQDKSVPLAIQSWGQTHLCSPKFSQDGAGCRERKWAECPVSDAKTCQPVARLEFTQLNRRCSGASSFPRLSYVFLLILTKVQACCELPIGSPASAPPLPPKAQHQVQAPRGCPSSWQLCLPGPSSPFGPRMPSFLP